MFSACENVMYYMWFINFLHLIASLRKTGDPSPGETMVPMLWPGPGVVVVAVVSVTRRVLAQQWCLDAGWPPPSPSPAFADHAPTLASCSFYGRPLHLNCQLSTRRIQTGAQQHIFSMATTFHSLCPSLQKDLDVSGPLCPAGTQRFRICPKLASRMKIALILLLSMSWSEYKNIFVFANFFVESTTYCISWMCYE